MKELESDGAALTMQTNQIHADGSNQVVDYMNNSISISTSVLITSPTNYKIDYEIFTLPMIDSCLDNICVDCVYELELSLKDECGAELLPDTLQNTLIGNFQLDALNNYVFHGQCTDTTSFNSDTTVYLSLFTAPQGFFQLSHLIFTEYTFVFLVFVYQLTCCICIYTLELKLLILLL